MSGLGGMLEGLFLDSNRSGTRTGGILFEELVTGEGTDLLQVVIFFLWFKYYTLSVGVIRLISANSVDMWSPYSFKY